MSESSLGNERVAERKTRTVVCAHGFSGGCPRKGTDEREVYKCTWYQNTRLAPGSPEVAGVKEVLTDCQTTQEGKHELSQVVFSREGELLTRTGDIVGRWKEHFDELLNLAVKSTMEEPEPEDTGGLSPISLAAVCEVVRNLAGARGECLCPG